MTEDEAQTKFCCGPSGTGAPRSVFYDAETDKIEAGLLRLCIGSACMAWRNDQQAGNLVTTDKGETVSRAAAAEFGWKLAVSGFCGLAGKQ